MIYNKDGTALSSAYSVSGQRLQSAYDVDGAVVFSNDLTMKVCTYNVGGWYIGSGTNVPAAEDSAYYALQNSMIGNIDADILCLEEYWTTFSKAGRTAESLLSQYYPYIRTAKGTTQYMGRAICSKYPIVSYASNYFSVDTSRYYDVAEINVNNDIIHVFVTHLSTSDQTWKITQATEIHNYIDTHNIDPFIICGDFNSTLTDPMSETNIGIYKQYLDDGCSIANDGAFGIFGTYCNNTDWENTSAGIDNIICSDIFSIESVGTNLDKITNETVLADGKIDHIPLYAVIKAVIQ